VGLFSEYQPRLAQTLPRHCQASFVFKPIIDLAIEEEAMSLSAEKELEHLGETRGCADHDHDLVHELSRRLDSVWRYDQYIANAEQRENIKQLWVDMKKHEQENIKRIKQLLKDEIKSNCF
jgi:hypothetical protein